MCPSQDCPVRGDCYRNEASGTVPNDRWQSWSGWTWSQPGGGPLDPVECDGWSPAASTALVSEKEQPRG